MNDFVKCSTCGIAEPADQLVDGVCEECRNEASASTSSTAQGQYEKQYYQRRETSVGFTKLAYAIGIIIYVCGALAALIFWVDGPAMMGWVVFFSAFVSGSLILLLCEISYNIAKIAEKR